MPNYHNVVSGFNIFQTSFNHVLFGLIQKSFSSSKTNEIMLFAATWIDLEVIILNEVSQRKTNIM